MLSSPFTLTGLSGGAYSVSVATSCGVASTTATLSAPATPTVGILASSNPSACGASNGRIDLNLSGLPVGSTYTIIYSSGTTSNTLVSSTSPVSLTGLAAGSYSIYAVSAGGCSSTTQTTSLSDPGAPAAPLASANPGVICGSGGSTVLSASGVAGATFNWSGANLSSTTGSQVTASPGFRGNNVYTVTQTVNGCVSPAATVTVVVQEQPLANAVASASVLCAGQSLTLTTNASGDTYKWGGPGLTNPTNASSVVVNSAPSGVNTYTVTVTNGDCVSTGTVSVTVNPALTLSIAASASPTSCSQPNGSIRLGGLSAPNSYTVSYTVNGGSAITTVLSSPFTLTGLSGGAYSVSVATSCGVASTTATLSAPATPTVGILASSNPSACGASNGRIDLNLSGLPVGSTYTIIYSSGASSGTLVSSTSPVNLTGLAAGSYSIYAV
ncbi:hypothetical protein, partial [Spirosoma gilvum]